VIGHGARRRRSLRSGLVSHPTAPKVDIADAAPDGNNAARRDSWPKIVAHLAAALE
jgi:hypothetical protein